MHRLSLMERMSKWWAARSLVVGAISTALDLSMGLFVLWLGAPTRVAAMSGTLTGATWTYFALRHLAFKDHKEALFASSVKFVVVQVGLSLVHGQLCVWFRDGLHIPYVPAKMLADIVGVTFPQLWLMRNFVFPRHPSHVDEASAEPEHATK